MADGDVPERNTGELQPEIVQPEGASRVSLGQPPSEPPATSTRAPGPWADGYVLGAGAGGWQPNIVRPFVLRAPQNPGPWASGYVFANPYQTRARPPTETEINAKLDALAHAYKLPRALVRAIARTESGYDVAALNANRDKHGNVISWDYGLMQVNAKNILGWAKGPDGKPFRIPETAAFNWEDNANAGVAVAASEYRQAVSDQPSGTAETIAQQTYSGYNAGPGGRTRYAKYGPPRDAKSGYFIDERDYHFLGNHRKERP